MKRRFLLLAIALLLTSVTFAQLWNDLALLRQDSPKDSVVFGISMSCKNIISKTESRDYSVESGKKLSYTNPSFAIEMAYDVFPNSLHDAHMMIGWDGIFAFDYMMTRARAGVRYYSWIFGFMMAKRVVPDKEGEYLTRYGSFRHDVTVGLFLEQHKDFFSLYLYGECAKNETYHFLEVSKCFNNYPRFWIAVSSESLKGYGPRIYYKARNKPLSFHVAMNIAPPMYREYVNVSNSLEFGLRQVFY